MNRADRRRNGERGPLAELPTDSDFGVAAAWCSGLEAVEETKKRTHDNLLELMGDRRVGPVQWLIERGDAARKVLDMLRPGAAVKLADYYDGIEARLKEFGGLLVVAIAEGRQP